MRNKALIVFEFFAILIYIVLGLFLLVQPQFFGNMTAWVVRLLGTLLVIYGLYRVRRAIRRIQQSANEQDNE